MNILRTEQVLPLPHVELSPPGKHRLSPATSESRFFQEQSTIPDRSGGVCNAAIQLFRQNLTKINEAKGNKTKQKKSTQGFFSSTYL